MEWVSQTEENVEFKTIKKVESEIISGNGGISLLLYGAETWTLM